MIVPVKILLFIGLNLPGNRYNLTFSYKGKKRYSSNWCALTSVFIVAFVIYYFYLSFRKVGINLNVSSQKEKFLYNQDIKSNYSSISYFPFDENKSIFMKKLPIIFIKNIDTQLDLCSFYNEDNLKK